MVKSNWLEMQNHWEHVVIDKKILRTSLTTGKAFEIRGQDYKYRRAISF